MDAACRFPPLTFLKPTGRHEVVNVWPGQRAGSCSNMTSAVAVKSSGRRGSVIAPSGNSMMGGGINAAKQYTFTVIEASPDIA
jgi:hypothetical protein